MYSRRAAVFSKEINMHRTLSPNAVHGAFAAFVVFSCLVLGYAHLSTRTKLPATAPIIETIVVPELPPPIVIWPGKTTPVMFPPGSMIIPVEPKPTPVPIPSPRPIPPVDPMPPAAKNGPLWTHHPPIPKPQKLIAKAMIPKAKPNPDLINKLP